MIDVKTGSRSTHTRITHTVPSAQRPQSPDSPTPRPRIPWGATGLGLLLVAGLAAAVVTSLVSRQRREQEMRVSALESAASAPLVTVTHARPSPSEVVETLPGNAQPQMEASLFARATGYIKTRLVDIGDRVKKGQLLAEIDSPEMDNQLAQARANLEQARANLKQSQANEVLASVVLSRSMDIGRKGIGIIPREEIDKQRATASTTAASVEAAKASIQVADAAVKRFAALQAFEKITAPFDGVITVRNIDCGDLVSADSTTRELFHLAQTDVLSVYVNVPQVFATRVAAGQRASIYRRENMQAEYPGSITRTADALDPRSRTLLTEVQVPNPSNTLRAGMFVQVKLTLRRETASVLIPTAALVTRTSGTLVAVLDDAQRVEYRDVKLGRDYGAEIEVVTGLKAGEVVVVRPGDQLPAGQTVVARAPQ